MALSRGYAAAAFALEARRRLGRDVGLAWTQRDATIDERVEVSAADEQDWSSAWARLAGR